MTLPNTPHGGAHETLAPDRGPRTRFPEPGEPTVHDSDSGLFSHPVVAEPYVEPVARTDHRPVFRNAATDDRQPADERRPVPATPGNAVTTGRLFSRQEPGRAPAGDDTTNGNG